MATFPKALCELRALWTEGGLSRFWRAADGQAARRQTPLSNRSDAVAGDESAAADSDRNGGPGGSSSS